MVESFFQRSNVATAGGGAANNTLDIGLGTGTGTGYGEIVQMASDIAEDLQVNTGFSVISSPGTVWILEAVLAADPLWVLSGEPAGFETFGNQNWRIALTADPSVPGVLDIYWGTEIQIDPSISGGPVDGVALNTPFLSLIVEPTLIDRVGGVVGSFKYQYLLSVSDRGFALSVFPNGKQNDAYFARSIVIQRPTNPVDGSIKQQVKAPVFVVFSTLIPLNDINSDFERKVNASEPDVSSQATDVVPGFKFGVVRDRDNPTPNTPIVMNVTSSALLYTFDFEWFQPALLDNFNHVIKFPFGMCLTGRHVYLDEMDMMGLVNGATFSFEQEATIDLYTPTEARTYLAGPGHVGQTATFIDDTTGVTPPNLGKKTDHWGRLVFLKAGPSILGTP